MGTLPESVGHAAKPFSGKQKQDRGEAISKDSRPEFREQEENYECGGYRVRVHFNGTNTFAQCIKNLARRKGKDGFGL